MTMNSHGGSATIYQFPARGRFAVGGLRDDAKLAANDAALRLPIAYGGSWYHDEAIEAERARNN